MELEEGLYTYLSSQAALTALIGTRIYPVFLPESKPRPALVYARLSTQWGEPGGTDLKDDPLTTATISFVVWAESQEKYSECSAITKAVRDALLSSTRGSWGEIGLQSVTWVDQADVFEESLVIPGIRSDYRFIFSV